MMGVTSLWSVLEEVGEKHSLSDDTGMTLAIDLSSWIVQGIKAANKTGFANENYLMFRTIFFRTMNLLKLGLKPVFVLDGQAPAVKEATLRHRKIVRGCNPGPNDRNRKGHREIADMCCQLFRVFGIPCVESPGEAEKMCACLNKNQLVGACLCDDNDIFLYGAQTVYRNFDLKKPDTTVEKYTMQDITKKLGLDRQSLVVFALLSGSDYGDGIPGIGVKKTMDFIKSMREKYNDVLQRVFSWRDDTTWQNKAEQLELSSKRSKPPHCSNCGHPGNVSRHKSKGCRNCYTKQNCVVSSPHACPCSWHLKNTTTEQSLMEHSIRKKAMQIEDFPQKKIVDEFLVDYAPTEKPKWKMPPNLSSFYSVLKKFLKWDQSEVNRKILPVLVHMHLHGIEGGLHFQPISIKKSFTKNFKPCFKTKWTAKENPNDQNSFEVDVSEDLFASKYSKMTEEYRQKSCSRGKKHKLKEDKNQTKLNSYFPKRKKTKLN